MYAAGLLQCYNHSYDTRNRYWEYYYNYRYDMLRNYLQSAHVHQSVGNNYRELKMLLVSIQDWLNDNFDKQLKLIMLSDSDWLLN